MISRLAALYCVILTLFALVQPQWITAIIEPRALIVFILFLTAGYLAKFRFNFKKIFLNGVDSRQNACQWLSEVALFYAAIYTILNIVSFLANIGDPSAIGPATAVSMLPWFYAYFFYILLFVWIGFEVKTIHKASIALCSVMPIMYLFMLLMSFVPSNGEKELHVNKLIKEKKYDDLLKHKSTFNQWNHRGNSPLMFAIKNNDLEAIKILLDNGANIDLDTEALFLTPMSSALRELNEEIIDELIKHNPTISVGIDIWGAVVPLDKNAQENTIRVVKKVLQNSVILDNPYPSKEEALDRALDNEMYLSADFLIDQGANPLFRSWKCKDKLICCFKKRGESKSELRHYLDKVAKLSNFDLSKCNPSSQMTYKQIYKKVDSVDEEKDNTEQFTHKLLSFKKNDSLHLINLPGKMLYYTYYVEVDATSDSKDFNDSKLREINKKIMWKLNNEYQKIKIFDPLDKEFYRKKKMILKKIAKSTLEKHNVKLHSFGLTKFRIIDI